MFRPSVCWLTAFLSWSLCAVALAVEPASTDNLKVEGAKPSHLSSENDIWGAVPDFVEGATLLRPSTGNVLQFTAKKELQVLIVASWIADGDLSGDWYPSRTSPVQLYKQGWEMIGLMQKKDQEYNFILRRTLKAGEEVKFHTRKVNPPFILLPAPGKLAAIAKTPAYKTSAHSLALLTPPPPGPAAAAGKVVLLRTTEPDLYEPFEVRGTLLRELVRQAVLLAAREEMGLSTRDETLHEHWSAGPADGPHPLDVVVSATMDHRVKVTLCRMRGPGDAEIFWDEEMRLPPEEDLILALTLKSELLSRKDFVEALRKSGFAGKANPVFDKKPVPEEVSGAALHLIPQFAAARQLHQLMKEEGESPERLVALARIYAHLGVLSEHFWYQGHKAFQARGLLYSQRATARWPKSATAWYGRGYVRALVGLHAGALEDLAAAGKLNEGGQPPEWIAGVESYCRFDLKKLDALAVEQPGMPRLLRVLAQENLGTAKPIGEAVDAMLKDVIDCDRAFEVAYRTLQLDMSNFAQRQAHRRSGEVTLPHAGKIPGLPQAAAKICKEEMASRTMPGLLDELPEYPRRSALIQALRDETKGDPDLQEPSWQVLATLVEEVSFVQTVRTVLFLRTRLAVSTEQARATLAPLIAQHPLRNFVESFTNDTSVRQAYLVNLLQSMKEVDLSANQAEMRSWIHGTAAPNEDRVAGIMLAHQDLTYRDLLATIQLAPEPLQKSFCSELRRISPHSPLAIQFTIERDWETAAPQAARWEKEFADSPHVQTSLGDRYLRDKKYPDAIRCLERAAEMRSAYDDYRRLADCWLEQKDEKKWQAAWDKFLEGTVFGLDHARARVNVAEHFMLQGRFEEALPYAEAAAQSYSGWSLICASDCLSGLKRYEEADRYALAESNRYPPDGVLWRHFWRERVGWGDLKKTRGQIFLYLADPKNKPSPVVENPYWIIAGEKEKALTKYRQSLAQVRSPQFAWMAAILFDERNDSKNRDIALQIVVDTGNKPEYNLKYLVDLAELCQAALKDPRKLDSLPKQVEELLATMKSQRIRCETTYLAGKFLELRGKKVEGEALLKKAAESPFTQVESALAAKELRDREAAAKDGGKKQDSEKQDGDKK
ncbi:MAG: tetratricopeptide repeat protein [Planctomycetales bacterium]|nr:tetratricopeptide repeat protein [Planctomycetales bacterium]